MLMHSHAEAHEVKSIRLTEFVFNLDKYEPLKVHLILDGAFHQANMFITLCIQSNTLAKMISEGDVELKKIEKKPERSPTATPNLLNTKKYKN